MMSTIKENETPQICTYIFKIQHDDDEHEDNADLMKNKVQSLLGSEHEVMSLSKMKFNTRSTDDSSFLQHVIKVKTNSPTHVAAQFMGNDWVREDFILFKARPRADISDNAN